MGNQTTKQVREYMQAWARARLSQPVEEQLMADVLDKLIVWELFKKDMKMQRTWKIEVTADFADETKYESISREVKRAAVLLNATTALGMDQGVKPMVVCYSDDFFGNHEDIDMWAKDVDAENAPDALGKQDELSDELRQAMQDMANK